MFIYLRPQVSTSGPITAFIWNDYDYESNLPLV